MTGILLYAPAIVKLIDCSTGAFKEVIRVAFSAEPCERHGD